LPLCDDQPVKGWRSAFVSGVLAAAVVTSSVAGAAPARAAADDVSLVVCLSASGPGGQAGCLLNVTTTNQLTFGIVLVARSSAAVIQPVRLTIQLPTGLAWATGLGPTAAEGCTGTSPVVCSKQLGGEVGEATAGWAWHVVAAGAGIYEIAASLATTEGDPNTANNTSAFRVTVAPPSAAPSPPATPAVRAGSPRVAPARPKAGSNITVRVPVRVGSQLVRPIGVRCTAVIGRLRLTGTARATAGTATCVYRTPSTARGKTVRGALSFRAAGVSIKRTFTIRLL